MKTMKLLNFLSSSCYIKNIVVVGFACLLTDISVANINVTLSPTLIFENNGRTQTVLLNPAPINYSNEYVSSKKWHNSYMTLLSFTKDVCKKNDFVFQVGPTLSYANGIGLAGHVNQFALPDFDNFNYQYSVRSFSLLASTFINYVKNDIWQPYLSFGLGVSWNRTLNYNETPRKSGVVPMSPYSSGGTNGFAYSIGAGYTLNYDFPVKLGFGYEFSDLGATKLGLSRSQTTMKTPRLRHLYLNELLLNLNWVI
jgi:opacity protein-like surface antigen